MDEFGRPAGQDYANQVGQDQAALAGQRGRSAATPPKVGYTGLTDTGAINTAFNNAQNRVQQAATAARTTAGGTTVSGMIPGAGVPGSASSIENSGYTGVMEGDKNAVAAVMNKLLSAYGIDISRPGAYTASLVRSLAPYLETFMKYSGLSGEGEPARDKAKALADQFGGMIGSGGTFQQIQNAAQGMLGNAGDMLSTARYDLADPGKQQGIVNDLLGMLIAGDNPIRQQSVMGGLQGLNLDYETANLGNAGTPYWDFLTQQAKTGKLPGGDLLAALLAGTGGR